MRWWVAVAAVVLLSLPGSTALAGTGQASLSRSLVKPESHPPALGKVASPPPRQIHGRAACHRVGRAGARRVSVCVAGLKPLPTSGLKRVIADTGSATSRALLSRCSTTALADRFETCATARGALVVKRRTAAGAAVRRIPLAFVQIWKMSTDSLLIHHSVYIDPLEGAYGALLPAHVAVADLRSRDGHVAAGAARRHRLTADETSVWHLDDRAILHRGSATSGGSGITYVAESRAGIAPLADATVGPGVWRCNRAGAVTGCVSPLAPPTLTLDANANRDLDLAARQVRDAQSSGAAGAPGSGRPLRKVGGPASAADRAAACAGLSPDGQFTSCSVYPPANSQEAKPAARPNLRALTSAATNAANAAMQSFVRANHVLTGDRFYEAAEVRTDRTGPRILVVGDSITEGHEGEATWRYRLWQELTVNDVDATFVGPWLGTDLLEPLDYAGPTPPHDGSYRPGIDFDSANDAKWGWTMDAATPTIQSTVASYRPNIILVELGYNDLAFGALSPAGLINELQTFIQQARAAKPNVAIFVGNVVHRDPATTSPNIETDITTYDDDLPGAVSSLSTTTSPIVVVDDDSQYPTPQDTYDGLHPNNVGEYAIAGAFADSLSVNAGIGEPIPAKAIPTTVVYPRLTTPTGLTAIATAPGTITLTWHHVFGATTYGLYHADLTQGQQLTLSPFGVEADGDVLTGLTPGDRYQFALSSQFGPASSPVGAPVDVIATPSP